MTTKYKNDYKSKIVFTNKAFQKILTFYMFECPVYDTSVRGKKLCDYGWNSSALLCTLVRSMKNIASKSFKDNYHACQNKNECLKYKESPEVNLFDEYCMFISNDRGKIHNLFKAIRNSLAHGSFNVYSYSHDKLKHRVYYFQNFNEYKKAEMYIREKTLLDWIKLIKNGPCRK